MQVTEEGQPATWPEIHAGRMDTVSYHGDGIGPYKAIYVDDPDGTMHLGSRLPATLAEVQEALGRDCREWAAEFEKRWNAYEKLVAALNTVLLFHRGGDWSEIAHLWPEGVPATTKGMCDHIRSALEEGGN